MGAASEFSARIGKRAAALADWWNDRFLRNDAFLGITFAVAASGACEIGFYLPDLGLSPEGWFSFDRRLLYGVMAGIDASLLGFTLASLSIILGLVQAPVLRRVFRSANATTLWSTFFSAARWLALGTVACLMALVSDRQLEPLRAVEPASRNTRILLYLLLLVSTMALLRLWRCLWLLRRIIGVVTADARRGTGEGG